MAGGRFDSSLTRVRPVFDQLWAKDRSGSTWIDPLLRLGSRAARLALPPTFGSLVKPPIYEHPCLAPDDLLRWMVQNGDRLDKARLDSFEPDGETHRQRTQLLARNPSTIRLALDRLSQTGGREPGPNRWHVLEGITKVDCALFFERARVFVEGKRTEKHLTDHVSWLATRSQVIRNLDCLRVEPGRPSNWYVLLVVEAGTSAEKEAQALDRAGPTEVRASCPQLSDTDATELWSRYLGYTNWQSISNTFGLALPETTAD